MIVFIGIVSIFTFIILIACWVFDNFRKNNSLTQQELNRNKVNMILEKTKKNKKTVEK